ncbi:hypothetical protein ACFP3U_21235 [Kitasatospora misakiensis]|uniref:Uncharacterized protein n=1 Tax=Kitasatospora misakiensis TaxID=67330 RepID=A0ABW0X4M0_9ACTN
MDGSPTTAADRDAGTAPDGPVGASAPGTGTDGRRAVRLLPPLAALLVVLVVLLGSGTPPLDVARYAGYVLWAVLLPGTLVFRCLRRRPHTLVEDLVLGAVTGLVLELAAWAVLVRLGLQSVAVLWPLAVVVPFALVPALRRHWRPRGYTRPPLSWSWTVAGLVALTVGYFGEVFLFRFPILPTGEPSRIYGDLPYLISLAGNAKYQMPPTFPQAAGEPLHYHWFTFAHMAMSSLVGGVDLPVVAMRLMVPALSVLMVLAVAVAAHRLTGRLWAGPAAVVLFMAVGEFTAAYPNSVESWAFGAPAVGLLSWASLSLTYSQPLLVALATAVGEVLRGCGPEADRRGVPALGRGAFVLVGLFALASSAAKASTLPVTLGGLALVGLVLAVTTRRIPRPVVLLGGILLGAQLFATVLVFDFQSYGLQPGLFGSIRKYWADPQLGPAPARAAVALATLAAFLLNHQLRLLGAVPLIWRRRMRLEPVQWFLLGAALAGPAAYLLIGGFNASYFTIASAPFAALLSAWGWCELVERAALPRRAAAGLAVGAVLTGAALTWLTYRFSDRWAGFAVRLLGRGTGSRAHWPLLPMLAAALAVAAVAVLGLLLWRGARRVLPSLRGRGGVVALTGLCAVALPALPLDALQGREYGWDFSWALSGRQVEAARWVRARSLPSDVIATNSHCWEFDDYADGPGCDNSRSQWLSAYSERSVLVEGWAYAPRLVARSGGGVVARDAFWDQRLFRLNEDAVYRPTAEVIERLRREHRVRFLVVDRKAGAESPRLREYAEPVFDNGRVAGYRLP